MPDCIWRQWAGLEHAEGESRELPELPKAPGQFYRHLGSFPWCIMELLFFFSLLGSYYWMYRTLNMHKYIISVSSVQFSCSVVPELFATPWTAARQASLSITNPQSLSKLMSIESVMPSNRLILCCPLLLLPPTPPSIRIFSSESTLHIRWPKYWSFSFSISPSNERSGLISFRMDWLDLLAVQVILKSLLPHHSSKASILWHSAFIIVQLSYLYLTIGKTHNLD